MYRIQTIPKFRKLFRWTKVLLFGLLLALAPVVVPTPHWEPAPAYAGFFDDDLEVFEEVVDLVADNYVYPPDYKKLFSSAVDEMIRVVGPENLSTAPIYSGQTLQIGDSRFSYRFSFSRAENMAALRSVHDFLLKNLTGKISKAKLEFAAITGMMNSLDPYSMYLPKEEFERSMRDTEGQYGGVGMVITMEDLKLKVVRVLKNSPSERAGILPQDIITRVDGQEVKGMQIQELASRLRGYPNTRVSVNVYRPSTRTTQTYNLVREIISIETVTYQTLPGKIGYIRITSFSKRTNDQLEDALDKAKADQVRGFVLDLRDNPGGLLSQSVKVASHFLNKGDLIVYTRGRDRNDRQTYQALYSKSLSRFPLVVLVNHHSASASEIVAGSLKDLGKALVIGDNSYGKGSVQTIFRMGDGSGLRLTTSKYYTPSGIDITAHGITPEVKIRRDLPGNDANGSQVPTPEIGKAGTFPVPVTIMESELLKYLDKKGIPRDGKIDPLVSFARLIVTKATQATKSHTLAKAKELVKDMHY